MLTMDEIGSATLLSELDARARIADLVRRYALNIRNGAPLTCAELMSEDITFAIGERDPSGPPSEADTKNTVVGREAVLAYINRSAGGEVRIFPIIHNLLIDVRGDEAASSCLMVSRTWPAGHEFVGEYDDRFRRENGLWRFVARSFTMFKAADG